MKYEEHLYTIIHKIGLDPFYVFYWTPAQTIMFNEYVKNENMSKLYIDATGSICQRIERPNKNKSSHIFLYQGVIHSGTIIGQLPVTQMLSECHNINQITHWLSEWSANIKIPKIIVCDHSMALLGAIARSLAGEITLKSYMDKLFSVATFQSNMNVKTFIRIDYAHVMKFLSNWKCFNGKEKTVKKFYLKLMSRLIMCTSLKSAEGLIESILITSNSIFEGHDEKNNELAIETAKLYLKQSIAGMDEICVSDEDDDDDDDLILFQDIPNDENEDGCLKTWIDSIKEKSKVNYVVSSSNCIYEKENFHYLPDFSTSLLKLLRTYPLWSAIMIKHFNITELTASSSSVESYFNDLKKRSFYNDNLPLRVDKFVCKHIKEIDGMLKIAKHDQIFTKEIEIPDEVEIKTLNQIQTKKKC